MEHDQSGLPGRMNGGPESRAQPTEANSTPGMTWGAFLEKANLESSEEESSEEESQASSESDSDAESDDEDIDSDSDSDSGSESELDKDRLEKYGHDFVHCVAKAEAMDLPMDELELRAAVLNKVMKKRKAKLKAERKERRAAGLEEEEESGEGSEPELRGVCRGRKRRKPTRAQIQKKTSAKERMVKKYFAEMESELGVTAWCYGLTTAAGKLRVGGAESMTRWMAVKYRGEALKVNLDQTGEIQQELTKLAGTGLAVLLQMLNIKQLSSLAAGWFTRCQPSLKAFPLDGSKGKPSWWPDDVAFKKAASLKKSSLLVAALAAAKCICLGNTSDVAEKKLERVLATSPLLCNEPARVRAILHSVVAQALKSWQWSDEPEASDHGASAVAGQGEGHREGGGLGAGQGEGRAETGQGGADNGNGAGLQEEGPFAGIDGRQKRRRPCEISERPYKCSEEACNALLGYTSRSGLVKHMKAKHPNVLAPATAAPGVSSTLPTDDNTPAPASASTPAPVPPGVSSTPPADRSSAPPAAAPASRGPTPTPPWDQSSAPTGAAPAAPGVTPTPPRDQSSAPPAAAPAARGSTPTPPRDQSSAPTGAAPAARGVTPTPPRDQDSALPPPAAAPAARGSTPTPPRDQSSAPTSAAPAAPGVTPTPPRDQSSAPPAAAPAARGSTPTPPRDQSSAPTGAAPAARGVTPTPPRDQSSAPPAAAPAAKGVTPPIPASEVGATRPRGRGAEAASIGRQAAAPNSNLPPSGEQSAPRPKQATAKARSRRVPGTTWGATFRQDARTPLQCVDENGVQQGGRKRKKAGEPTFEGSLEDYCDYMTTVGREQYAGPRGPQVGGSASVREGKRRQAMLDRIPAAIRNKPVADALDARPAKHLYRSLGAESFELLVSGRAKKKEYESVLRADLRSFYDFARASKMEYRGVGEMEMRHKVQIALEYQLFRDHGLLDENGDHLRVDNEY